jgi:hypothetical protein
MALFFEYPTDLVQRPRGQVICASWSKLNSEHPIYGVATKNGDILMYHEEVSSQPSSSNDCSKTVGCVIEYLLVHWA